MTTKADVRRTAAAARLGLPPDARATADRRLAAALVPLLARATRVAAYVPVGTEPGTQALLRPGWLLPVLLAGGDLDWTAYDGELARSEHGLLEAPGARLGPDAVARCDLVLVPALLVDRRGNRLGRGGGSYDRALLRTRGLTVALLHDRELVEQVPTEPHDVPVAAAITPSGGLRRLKG